MQFNCTGATVKGKNAIIIFWVKDYPGWQIQATHALKALKIWVYVSGKILELRGNKIPTAQQAMDDYLNEIPIDRMEGWKLKPKTILV